MAASAAAHFDAHSESSMTAGLPGPWAPMRATCRRWQETGGDHNGPSPAWSEALDLVDSAFRVLAEAHDMNTVIVTMSDIYAAVIAHHLG
jgi:hypothetical protein